MNSTSSSARRRVRVRPRAAAPRDRQLRCLGANTSFLATRRGKLTLALLCGVAFLDFVDASIVNIALPSIRRALHFSVSGLQWVPSGYVLTYGGFMLLGGRAADLLGRRRVLVAAVVVIGSRRWSAGLPEARARWSLRGWRRASAPR
jgi:hypothetical protein